MEEKNKKSQYFSIVICGDKKMRDEFLSKMITKHAFKILTNLQINNCNCFTAKSKFEITTEEVEEIFKSYDSLSKRVIQFGYCIGK